MQLLFSIRFTGSTWCLICGIHSIPHIQPQQVKSRCSHNTLQDYFHREGIWLIPLASHWSNLKRPFSCDQTVIVLHQVFGLLSAQQEQGHLVHVRQSRKRRDGTCFVKVCHHFSGNLIIVIVGVDQHPQDQTCHHSLLNKYLAQTYVIILYFSWFVQEWKEMTNYSFPFATHDLILRQKNVSWPFPNSETSVLAH